MSKLPLLEKNAYINILIKDNGIWTHLAYTDFNATREYVLSDYTDIHSLRFLLDDNIFTKEFWFEYFANLETVFNWDIVDKNTSSIFTFRPFDKEGDGVSGVRVQIDDNQEYFDQIFQSVRDFSNDVSLRVVDDRYMDSILSGLSDRLDYEDLMYIDMDFYDFSIFRVSNQYEKNKPTKKLITKSKLSWNDDISVIDSIKDGRFKAFLATDMSEKDLINIWANLILDKPLVVKDPSLLDILRAYSTIQNYSIYRDNKAKLENFGRKYSKNVVIIGGNIPRILGESTTLLTVIDGLELSGNFDCYFDKELRAIAYGKSYINATESTDIILTKRSILPSYTKVIIPFVKKEMKNKVIFSGSTQSIADSKSDFYIFASQYTYINLPLHREKLVIEGSFRNGSKQLPLEESTLNLVSIPGSDEVSALLFDSRVRPIIYGTDAYANKIKLQSWINDSKS